MTAQRTRGVSNAFFLCLIAALILVAATFGYLYFSVLNSSKDATADSAKLIGVITGTDKPLAKVLDPRFKDANNDLIADPPADPAQRLNPDTLTFCFFPDNPEEERTLWKPFADHLAATTSKRVDYLMVTSPDEQLRALAEGKLLITALNTGGVPIAVCLAGFVPAYTLGSPDAGGYLHSEIIVPADSSIQSPADLKDHVLTFVDPASNSGCKAPMVILKTKFDLIPERDYTIRYSHGHDRSIAGIADHTYEAAAVASDILARLVAERKIAPSQFRSIYSSENFPAITFGYAYNLDPDLITKINQAFTTFNFKGTPLETRYAPTKQDRFNPINYRNDFTLVRFIDDQFGKPYRLPAPPAPPASEPATQPASLPASRP